MQCVIEKKVNLIEYDKIPLIDILIRLLIIILSKMIPFVIKFIKSNILLF